MITGSNPHEVVQGEIERTLAAPKPAPTIPAKNLATANAAPMVHAGDFVRQREHEERKRTLDYAKRQAEQYPRMLEQERQGRVSRAKAARVELRRLITLIDSDGEISDDDTYAVAALYNLVAVAVDRGKTARQEKENARPKYTPEVECHEPKDGALVLFYTPRINPQFPQSRHVLDVDVAGGYYHLAAGPNWIDTSIAEIERAFGPLIESGVVRVLPPGARVPELAPELATARKAGLASLGIHERGEAARAVIAELTGGAHGE